jgi:signal transduction histidine kinase
VSAEVVSEQRTAPVARTRRHRAGRWVALVVAPRSGALTVPDLRGRLSARRPATRTDGRGIWSSRASAHPLVDGVIAATALGGSLLLLSRGGFGSVGSGSELDPLGGLLAAGATVPLLFWRRAPFAVFVVTAVGSTLAAALGYALGVPLGPVAALYLLASSRAESRPWTPRAAGVVVALVAAFLAATAAADAGFSAVDLVHSALPWAVAWFAGERTRLRHAHIAALEDRVLRTEREAEQERLLAVAQERARIARDLHDSAGHAINVIAVRAGAARLRHDQDPERSLVALAAIEELARQTVEEIDLLVGALRDRGSPDRVAVDAPPGLASLTTLVARHADAGLVVTIDTAGTPRPLHGAVDQAAYRILQEAVTNAARHGAGPVRIELRFGGTSLVLTVINPVPATADARSSGGHGVIGMHERASLVGGTLEAGHVTGEFRVSARLPYSGQRA